ncbi:MAG: alpha/beta hydrolase [Bacteroidales bacterium]|nr:alpha/beta hydrolase [Bacteroidales bacterium]
MKSICPSRFLLIFSFVFFVFFMFSCKNAEDVIRDSAYIFENQTDYKTYFVKVDCVDNAEVKGRIYLVDDEMTMRAEPFIMNYNRKKYEVSFYDSITYVLKIKKNKNDRIEGTYADFYKKKKFVIYPYKVDDYHAFNLGRYRDEIFEVERISDVNYGKAKGFWTSIPDDTIDVVNIMKMSFVNSLKKKDLSLDMDIYIPKADTLEKRPLIMLIHGGAFFIGDKATVPYQKWCTHFASLGYVCVSINYRMGFRVNSKAILRTAYQATQDAHAAMRYLLSKREVYRIDPDYLFVGGASAGSITALNLAYMRNENRPAASYSSMFLDDLGDIETSGNEYTNSFKIRAIANMWGSIFDLKILENSNASIISFHGDEDVVLPYRYGYPFRALGEFQKVFFDKMYGSYFINQRANELGIRSELHTFHGEGHTLHLDEHRMLNDNFYTIQNEIVDFFYEELNPNPVYIAHDKSDVQLFTIDTTDVRIADWHVVGGMVLNESKGSVRASWFDDELYHELRVSGYYKNGLGFEDVYVIKEVRKYEDSSHK